MEDDLTLAEFMKNPAAYYTDDDEEPTEHAVLYRIVYRQNGGAWRPVSGYGEGGPYTDFTPAATGDRERVANKIRQAFGSGGGMEVALQAYAGKDVHKMISTLSSHKEHDVKAEDRIMGAILRV